MSSTALRFVVLTLGLAAMFGLGAATLTRPGVSEGAGGSRDAAILRELRKISTDTARTSRAVEELRRIFGPRLLGRDAGRNLEEIRDALTNAGVLEFGGKGASEMLYGICQSVRPPERPTTC